MKRFLFLLALILFSGAVTGPIFAVENPPARLDFPSSIQVTGEPAHGNLLKEVARFHLERRGCDPSSLDGVSFTNLSPGEKAEFTIPLAVAGDEHKSTPGSSWQVTFFNQPVPSIDPILLAFSNHPERLKRPGLLFEAGLIRNKPVRLRYYHHVEEEGTLHYVAIFLYNSTRKPARVHMLGATGGPSKDFLMAGHMANIKFFHRLATRQGWVEEIPPGAHLIKAFPVGKGEVISGTTDMILLEGGPLQMLVNSSVNPTDPVQYPLKVDETDRHARGAYPLAAIFTDTTYFLEEQERFFTIGDTPLADIFGGRNIRGNYGVSYKYSFNLVNDTGRPGAVDLMFQPRGGVATATFLVDGQLASIGTTRAFNVVPFARVPLGAGESRVIQVVTMPEDASNYPIRIILKTSPAE